MDGVHDLGGREGFGPIAVDEPEEPFHAAWEGRMWAIARATGQPDWTIDWWRHVRELVDPVDYLARPYFDSWAQTQFAALVDSGVLTLAEAVSGKAAAPVRTPPPAISARDAVAMAAKLAIRFDRETDAPPAYHVGDRVRATIDAAGGHTRLPLYVRGRPGVIHAHHGAHVFADQSARGHEEAQHLYSVAFAAADLWPEPRRPNDKVFLDLWESYLEAQ